MTEGKEMVREARERGGVAERPTGRGKVRDQIKQTAEN